MSPDERPARLGIARRIVLLVALLGLVATACGGGAASTTASSASDVAAEDTLLEGQFEAFADRQVDLEALQGHDVVLWFWAPW